MDMTAQYIVGIARQHANPWDTLAYRRKHWWLATPEGDVKLHDAQALAVAGHIGWMPSPAGVDEQGCPRALEVALD